MKDERLVSKMEGKTIFRSVWNSLMAWPDYPDPLILRQIYATVHMRRKTKKIRPCVTAIPASCGWHAAGFRRTFKQFDRTRPWRT